jgi:Tfp pilus assembly protein PilN
MKYIDLYTKDLSSKRWPENFFFNILLLGSISVIVIYFVVVSANLVKIGILSNNNSKLTAEKKQLLAKEEEFNRIVSEIARLRGDKKALTDILQTIEGLSTGNAKWSDFVKKLAITMNSDIWIDSFATDKLPGKMLVADISISGGGLTLESINKFVNNLEKEFGDVRISLKASKDSDLNLKFYTFSLTFLYKGDVK